MPRVHVDLPESFPFSTEIPLYLLHINPGNHLDNAMLLTLVSEARERLIRWLGYPDYYIDGCAAMTADAAVQYRSQAHWGEVMVVEMTANDFSRRGFDLVWRMTDQASGREVARGKAGMVMVDAKTQALAEVPASLRERFA
jgi:4-hydroxybenzoyl-CoA thioesterase